VTSQNSITCNHETSISAAFQDKQEACKNTQLTQYNMVVECCLQLPTWPSQFFMADCVGQSCFIPCILLQATVQNLGREQNPAKNVNEYLQISTENWSLCIYSIKSTTVHEFTKVLVHKQPSLLQNLAEQYLRHCLRFLAPALMLFPLALATTSRVWSRRSYIYKIADWRSDNTLQASILSIAQKQS
jgi:hypothetical protein